MHEDTYHVIAIRIQFEKLIFNQIRKYMKWLVIRKIDFGKNFSDIIGCKCFDQGVVLQVSWIIPVAETIL